MKGFVSITIPTKPYIKAYIVHRLGAYPVMNRESHIGSKFCDLLEHATNEEKAKYSNARYTAELRIRITVSMHRQRGCNINHTNIKNFNRYMEEKIKEILYDTMDEYIELLPSFEANLPAVRKKLGIDIEAWADDSIRKDYYRHRLAKKLPPLYSKTFTPTVPSDKYANLSW